MAICLPGRTVVTGATGFIGQALLTHLTQPVLLVRDAGRDRQQFGDNAEVHQWNAETGPPPADALRGAAFIFHLAGEPVAGGRWHDEKKRRIRDSRVLGTRHLVQGLGQLQRDGATLPTLISASATGYYGDRGDEMLDETSTAGDSFLARVCTEWEAEALQAADLGVRVVLARLAPVAGPSGGFLTQVLGPFKAGLGGVLAGGRQWMPWIHLNDAIGLLLHVALHDEISGPVNLCAPGLVTNREFTAALAGALGRPAVMHVPAFALKLALGEFSTEVLASQRVTPAVATRTGYAFRFPDLKPALRDVLDL